MIDHYTEGGTRAEHGTRFSRGTRPPSNPRNMQNCKQNMYRFPAVERGMNQTLESNLLRSSRSLRGEYRIQRFDARTIGTHIFRSVPQAPRRFAVSPASRRRREERKVIKRGDTSTGSDDLHSNVMPNERGGSGSFRPVKLKLNRAEFNLASRISRVSKVAGGSPGAGSIEGRRRPGAARRFFLITLKPGLHGSRSRRRDWSRCMLSARAESTENEIRSARSTRLGLPVARRGRCESRRGIVGEKPRDN